MIARIRKAMEEREEGFTLIELLVVMLIIGILAAIAIPIFLNQTRQARGTAVKSDLHQVEVTLESVLVDSPPCVSIAQSGSTVTVTPYSDAGCTTAQGNPQSVDITSGNQLTQNSKSENAGTLGSAGLPVKTSGQAYCLDMAHFSGSSTTPDPGTEYHLLVNAGGTPPVTSPQLLSGSC